MNPVLKKERFWLQQQPLKVLKYPASLQPTLSRKWQQDTLTFSETEAKSLVRHHSNFTEGFHFCPQQVLPAALQEVNATMNGSSSLKYMMACWTPPLTHCPAACIPQKVAMILLIHFLALPWSCLPREPKTSTKTASPAKQKMPSPKPLS